WNIGDDVAELQVAVHPVGDIEVGAAASGNEVGRGVGAEADIGTVTAPTRALNLHQGTSIVNTATKIGVAAPSPVSIKTDSTMHPTNLNQPTSSTKAGNTIDTKKLNTPLFNDQNQSPNPRGTRKYHSRMYSCMESQQTLMNLITILEALGASIDTVKIIRDRYTGASRGFAFAKFISIEHARLFMDANYPLIDVGTMKARIDYSHTAPFEDGDWKCNGCGGINFSRRIACYKCKADKNPTTATTEAPQDTFVNDGSKDVGHQPNKILLAIGLDPLTTEET
ncbi:RNA-binding protein 5, partial [Chytridiales sp. JEL 0842]